MLLILRTVFAFIVCNRRVNEYIAEPFSYLGLVLLVSVIVMSNMDIGADMEHEVC